jgi:single-stranded-DNA-specific exonuclease
VVRGRTVTRDSDRVRPAETRWKVRGANPDARRMAIALGISGTFGELLWQLGHRDAQACRTFLEPKLSGLSSPDAMADRSKLAQRLVDAIRRRERICVFGDYDCDGITSAAILGQACERLGGDVAVELASRFDGGYGLGAAALERIRRLSPQVVVTCDCGSSDHRSLRELGRAGVDCLVIDHHLVPDEPLPALAFLNPHRPECGYPFKGLASCGLALSVVAELRTQLGCEFDLRSCLDLVAIGTIADVAPLTMDNRALVRAGLRLLDHPQRPGIRALMRRARIEPGSTITAEDVAFRIAPRLNAPGRLGSPMPALRLLLAKDDDEAEPFAAEIEALQTARRAQQDAMLEDAEAEIVRQGWAGDAALVVGKEAYNVGIVGIVAGKLAERHGCPVVVYGAEGGLARGSVRGPREAALYDLVQKTADCLVRYGGHHAAAGLEVELSRLSEFRQRFVQACRESRASVGNSSLTTPATEVLLLDAKDEPMRVAKELLLLEPCGEGNRLPLLGVTGRLAAARELRGGHLRLEVEREGGDIVGGFGPCLGNRADSLTSPLMAVGTLRVSTFGGQQRAELLVRDVVRLPDDVGLSNSMAQAEGAEVHGGPP